MERVIAIPYVAAEAIADRVVAMAGDNMVRSTSVATDKGAIVRQALKPRQTSLYFAASYRGNVTNTDFMFIICTRRRPRRARAKFSPELESLSPMLPPLDLKNPPSKALQAAMS